MKYFLFIFFLAAFASDAQPVPKLLLPGEHTGFRILSFNEGRSGETGITQGETWHAVYVTYKKFEVWDEALSWDTTMRFRFATASSIQPLFFFQGFEPVQSGESADVSFRIWNFKNNRYCMLNKQDPEAALVKAESTFEIILEKDTFLILKGVVNKELAGPQLYIRWAGDLDGDGEADFLFRRNLIDESVCDLVVSVKGGKGGWKRHSGFRWWN